LLSGCDKRKPNTFMGNPNGDEPFVFKPCSLLTEPSNGWSDSTIGTKTDISKVVINPLNKDEVIFTASGTIYNFNRKTWQKQIIATNMYGKSLQINQFGEILFCDSSLNICKVKSNGDSLKVYPFTSSYPYWDYTGKFIYYQSTQSVSVLYKIGVNKQPSTYYVGMPQALCMSKISDKMVAKNSGLKTIFYKNIITGLETPIASNINVSNLTVSTDNQDNVYFSNDDGIYRADFISKKIDTLYKNCPSMLAGNTILASNTAVYSPHVSPNSGVLTFVYKHSIPIHTQKKYTVSYALEMDLITKKITEIKGLP
jgi:hypothetical protein